MRRAASRKAGGKIIVLGLRAAGKTTALQGLQAGELKTSTPVAGWSTETVRYDGTRTYDFIAWDVGGGSTACPRRQRPFKGCTALIFVVDSADHDRLDEAREQLTRLLREEDLGRVPLLVLGNKQDHPSAMAIAELTDRLMLDTIRQRPWFVQGCCATRGHGLHEGLEWLSTLLQDSRAKQGRLENVFMPQTRATIEHSQRIEHWKIGRESGPDSDADTDSTADTDLPEASGVH